MLGMFNVCLKLGVWTKSYSWKVSVISLLHSKENNVKSEVLLGVTKIVCHLKVLM